MKSTRLPIVAIGTGLLLLPLASGALRAQAPSGGGDKPKFEVASVRQNTGDDGKVMIGIQPGGRFNAVNVPLWDLIRQAYAIQRTQLVGAPDWAESARYDIVAKAETDIPRMGPGAPIGPLNYMLQDLLEDRFKLRVHRETRELPVYALTFAKTDRTLGQGLRASTVGCAAVMRGRGARGGPPPGPPPPGERPQCGMRVAPNQVLAGGVSLAQLTQMLSQFTQRIVLDRTGLDGNFDIDLTFTPERMPQGAPPPGAPPLTIDPNGPSLFTALQEQLGLKLESERAPVEVLVIDHVERPTP
ncbi:MAG TPA: TIGR03435 family protein, partial [Vicinamibacterales bacterium]|nr:TIGR03435 family protein [Vicinamibacterales bacterium]